MISYSLPYPVSVNSLFVEINGKRVKTRLYKEWRTEAGWAIRQQQSGAVRKSITGHVMVILECVKPDKRKRDASNLLKAVEDLIVEMGVIDDDSFVMDSRSRWVRQGPPCRVTIVSSPAELDPLDHSTP